MSESVLNPLDDVIILGSGNDDPVGVVMLTSASAEILAEAVSWCIAHLKERGL